MNEAVEQVTPGLCVERIYQPDPERERRAIQILTRLSKLRAPEEAEAEKAVKP